MESKAFIKSELDSAVKEFSNIKVRYEFDKYADVHTIEVTPIEVYRHNLKYMAWESDLFDRFISLFPEENICFVSDDALVGVEKEDYVVEGDNYYSLSIRRGGAAMLNSSISVKHKDSSVFEQITFFETKGKAHSLTNNDSFGRVLYNNISLAA